MLKTLSALGYILMIGGLVALLALHSLVSASLPMILVQLAAVTLLIWARISFGRRSYHVVADPTSGGLVTTGPYRYIRHPIYSSMCLFVWAAVVSHWSLRSVLIGLLVLGSALVRLFCEEALVSAQYPEYKQYAARTWRMVPYVF
jgi:protein-S-isoprenylcysteine O-methyltransferase Ste14